MYPFFRNITLALALLLSVINDSSAKEAGFIKLSEWGTATPNLAAKIDGKVFLVSAFGTTITVQDLKLMGEASVLGELNLDIATGPIVNIHAFNDELVIATNTSVLIFDVSDIDSPKQLYRMPYETDFSTNAIMGSFENDLIVIGDNGVTAYKIKKNEETYELVYTIDLFEDSDFSVNQTSFTPTDIIIESLDLFHIAYSVINHERLINNHPRVALTLNIDTSNLNDPNVNSKVITTDEFSNFIIALVDESTAIVDSTSGLSEVFTLNADEEYVFSQRIPPNSSSQIVKSKLIDDTVFVLQKNLELLSFSFEKGLVTLQSVTQLSCICNSIWGLMGAQIIETNDGFILTFDETVIDVNFKHGSSPVMRNLFPNWGLNGTMIKQDKNLLIGGNQTVINVNVSDVSAPYLENVSTLDLPNAHISLAENTQGQLFGMGSYTMASIERSNVDFEAGLALTIAAANQDFQAYAYDAIFTTESSGTFTKRIYKYSIENSNSYLSSPIESGEIEDPEIRDDGRFLGIRAEILAVNETFIVTNLYYDDTFYYLAVFSHSGNAIELVNVYTDIGYEWIEGIELSGQDIFVAHGKGVDLFSITPEGNLMFQKTIFSTESNILTEIGLINDYLYISELITDSEYFGLKHYLFKKHDNTFTLLNDDLPFAPNSKPLVEDKTFFWKDGSSKTINIAQVNTSPEMAQTTFEINEDSELVLDLNGLDPEGDLVTALVRNHSDDVNVSFNDQQNTLTFVPQKDFFGASSALVNLSDENGFNKDFTLQFTVLPQNDIPTISVEALDAEENMQLEYEFPKYDVDGDELIYSLVTGAKHGQSSLTSDGTLIYSVVSEVESSDTITIAISDNVSEIVEYQIAINIKPVNDAPTLQTLALYMIEDEPSSFELIVIDEESDDVEVSIVAFSPGVSNASIVDGNSIQINPATDFHGEAKVTVVVSDEHSATNEFVISIDITSVNDAPKIETTTIEVDQGNSISRQIQASDDDDSSPIFRLIEQPKNGSIEVSEDGEISYTPNTGFSGNDSFTISATDRAGASAQSIVNIVVKASAPTTPPQTSDEISGGSLSWLMLLSLLYLFIGRYYRKCH